jgi:uncharacterized protein YjcR
MAKNKTPKKELIETEFSKFLRNASSSEKEKLFKKVIDESIEDQRKIMGY